MEWPVLLLFVVCGFCFIVVVGVVDDDDDDDDDDDGDDGDDGDDDELMIVWRLILFMTNANRYI